MDKNLVVAQRHLFTYCNIFVTCEGTVAQSENTTTVMLGSGYTLYRINYEYGKLVSIHSYSSDDDENDEESFTLLWSENEVRNVRPLVATMWKYGYERHYMTQDINESAEAFKERVRRFAGTEWNINGYYTLKSH